MLSEGDFVCACNIWTSFDPHIYLNCVLLNYVISLTIWAANGFCAGWNESKIKYNFGNNKNSIKVWMSMNKNGIESDWTTDTEVQRQREVVYIFSLCLHVNEINVYKMPKQFFVYYKIFFSFPLFCIKTKHHA